MRSLDDATATAPNDQRGTVDQLRDAVTSVASAMDAYAAETTAYDEESLDAVQQTQRWLEEALRAVQQRRAHTAG